jgi:hypothetical protein
VLFYYNFEQRKTNMVIKLNILGKTASTLFSRSSLPGVSLISTFSSKIVSTAAVPSYSINAGVSEGRRFITSNSQEISDDESSKVFSSVFKLQPTFIPEQAEAKFSPEQIRQLQAILNVPPRELMDPVTFKGGPQQQFLSNVRDLHKMMRENYAQMIPRIGRNIYPLIVALDNEPGLEGIGGSYHLFLKDRSHYQIAPVSPIYELYKNLSHMALGLFTIIAPSFDNLKTPDWQDQLKVYKGKLERALGSLDDAQLDKEVEDRSRKMLGLTLSFVNDCLATGDASIGKYQSFSEQILPLIYTSMDQAAKIQMRTVIAAIEKWKAMLGPEWRDVYVAIPTIWPVTLQSPRQQIFQHLMDKDRIGSHLIIMEGVPDLEKAKDTLGRIVGDRLVGYTVFGNTTKEGQELVANFSTQFDVVSTRANDAVQEIQAEKDKSKGMCPMRPQ